MVGDNITSDVYSREDALKLAKELELDLVEVVPNAEPPVCRIIEYQKFLYDKKKKEKEMKAKQGKQVVKEIRFGPNTDDHDFNFKVKHARAFIEEGSKVKASVMFRGREITHQEIGKELLEKFIEEMTDIAKLDQPLKFEGKNLSVILTPLKVKGKQAASKKD